MHFFNPAPVMPLVEIVRTAQTSDDAFEAAYAFAERIGKQPVACNDTPGFIVNRILIPLLNDCVRVLDEAGVSGGHRQGDEHGAGWPMGPCALVDLVGIDVHVHASEALHGELGEERMAPPQRLVEMQERGQLGRKTGPASTVRRCGAATASSRVPEFSSSCETAGVVDATPRS